MASSPDTHYSPQNTAERLIAIGRVILGGFFLLAIWLDPTEPSRYASLSYSILAGYVGYALILAFLTHYRLSCGNGLQLATHAVDMAVFAILVFLTQGPNSPFFVYFVFLLVCAALRWQWRGTLWTAGAALAMTVAMAFYEVNLLHAQDFELNRCIIRIVYLAVVAMLLGYLGAHEAKLRRLLSRLTTSPRSASPGMPELAHEILEHAAHVFDAPRTVLLWEEDEEPWLHLASWSQGEFSYLREHPSTFGDITALPLVAAGFFCLDVRKRYPVVIYSTPDGLRRWQGVPLHAALQERLSPQALLSIPWKGENASGHLLVLDKPRMNADDLMLAEITAQGIAARFDHHFFLRQLQQAAALEERVRLSRDLHDGLLQSLTGAALQLETVQRLLEADPQTARQRLLEVQHLIAGEQRDLRTQVQQLKPLAGDLSAEPFELNARIEELAERIRTQWKVSVEVGITPSISRIKGGVGREIYFLVHEGLINAVRHSGASDINAELLFTADGVRIVITDNGHGFPFNGFYDNDALFAMKRGPVTLKERTASLGGTLSIDSQSSGSRLDIALPLAAPGGRDAH